MRAFLDGTARGPAAALSRVLRRGAAVVYGVGVSFRNRSFDAGLRRARRVGAPVISVGNLTTGGTGKTPFVAWLARTLGELGARPAILSRGYGSQGGPNDEALVLAQVLPNVRNYLGPDRVASAQKALREAAADVFVLDDGFQHRRLHRDLDVVLVDATDPFGGERLLPAGFLREPLRGLARAGYVLLTRADAIGAAERGLLAERLRRLAPGAGHGEVAFRPTALVQADGRRLPLERIRGARVLAFCGIGNPRPFFDSLAGLGATVVQGVAFPDHHAYRDADLQRLSRLASESRPDLVAATQKDLVKIRQAELGGVPLAALWIEAEWLGGEGEFLGRLREILRVAKPQAE